MEIPLCPSSPLPICFNQIFFVLLPCLVPLSEEANASLQLSHVHKWCIAVGPSRHPLTTKDNYCDVLANFRVYIIGLISKLFEPQSQDLEDVDSALKVDTFLSDPYQKSDGGK